MEREQIIKALECCVKSECNRCPLRNGRCANGEMGRLSLTIIKELTEENKAWQKQLIATKEESGKAYYELACEVEDLRAENETLKIATNDQYSHLCDCHDKIAEMLRQKEAETVREMQERLKKYLDDFYNSGEDALLDVPDLIDQIAKEMLEGKE